MNKVAIVLAISLLAVACSKSVKQMESRFITGPKGEAGEKGDTGNNGLSSLIAVLHSAPTCLAGGITVLTGVDSNNDNVLSAQEVSNSVPVCNGVDGNQGATGQNGHNAVTDLVGYNNGGGASCPNKGITLLVGTDLNDNGLLDLTEVVSSRDVCDGVAGANGSNGSNGANGQNGATGQQGNPGINGTNAPSNPFEVVELVDPCGDQAGAVDEIFLRLRNNTLIASFSENENGNNTRFAVIGAGSYMTTDGTRCFFSVDAQGNLFNERF